MAKTHCIAPPLGRVETSKDSELNKKLVELFPKKLNGVGGSIYYDQLFTDKFKQFFGDWTSKDIKTDKFYEEHPTILNTQGEPDLKDFQGEYYFVNSNGEKYPINRKNLSARDRTELVNALGLHYIKYSEKNKDKVRVARVIRLQLDKINKVLLDRIEELENQIEDIEDTVEEDEIQALEKELSSLKKANMALENEVLNNTKTFKTIVNLINSNLEEFNLKYIADPEDKEEDELTTASEIQAMTIESSEVRDTNNIDSEIKAILASIPAYDVDINENETPRLTKLLKMPMAVNANIVKNKIIENLSNIIEVELSTTGYIDDVYDTMIEKLNERFNENNDLIIRDFLGRVDKIFNSKSKNDQEAFKTAFVTSFYKAQNIFSITEININSVGKISMRHIDPSSSQDKQAFIGNEFVRSIQNKFNYSESNKEINNINDYTKARKLLTSFKSANDIDKGLKLLGIEMQYKTASKLYKNKENIFLSIDKKRNPKTLKDLFKDLFEQEIKYINSQGSSETKVASTGLKMILEAYSKSDNATQSNINKALTDKEVFTPFNVLARYESFNKEELSDASLFVGNKQRWMYSLMSGINKEILAWKAGNINSLLFKKHKNLTYVNYLLDLDNVERGLYAENSPSNIREREKRINNLKLIINSELKKPNDPAPIQHKEIGEADLHMDNFFKMFNFRDEIYKTLDQSQDLDKSDREKITINPYSLSADKSTAFGFSGLYHNTNTVVIDKKTKDIKSVGNENFKIIKGYLQGEFEELLNNTDLIQTYLNKKTKKEKLKYAAKYLIPDFHYATEYKDANGNKVSHSIDEVLTADFINLGTWNKFGIFNSLMQNNPDEFEKLFKYQEGVRLGDVDMKSHINDVIANIAADEIVRISKSNLEYLDKIIIKQDSQSNVPLFDVETNIVGSTTIESKYNYIIASLINNFEMFSLFNGNVAFYKQSSERISLEDALKRGPAVLTDGLYIRQTKIPNIEKYKTFDGEEVEVDKNRFTTVAIANNIKINKSKFIKQIREASGDNTLTMEHEIADAQGLITMNMYKRIISGIYGWTDSDEVIFNRLQNKDYNYTDEDIHWLKASGRSQGPLKMTGFNLEIIKNEKGDILGQFPVYLKYSTAVLAPAIVSGTDVEKLLKQMEKQNVDQVVFKSGSKASNRQPTTIHNEEDGEFSGLKDDMVLNPFTFNLSGLKLQVELPTKFNKEGVLGNQHLKNLIANLDLNNEEKVYEFRGEKLSARKLYNEYENTIKNILQSQLSKFLDKIDLDTETGKFEERKLRELITEQLDAGVDQDLIDIISNQSLPLEVILGISQRAFPIISSYIHKNVGKVRTNSGSAIQVANIGFDRVIDENKNNIVYLSKDKELRPPLPVTDSKGNILYFDENDKLTDKKSGKMKIAKARIMMPFSSIYEKTGMSYEEFKSAFAEGRIDTRIFENIIGYRIPNQSISSNDSIEVVGILPPSMGDTAIVYHEITAKTGSDFDIDKMYLMMPNFYLDDQNNIKYVEELTSNKGQQNKLIELMGSILTNQRTYNDLISPLDSDIPKDAINEVLYIKSILTDKDFENKMSSLNSMSQEDKGKFLKKFASERKLTALEQLAPVGMVKSRVDMLQAKKLVATMANHMTDIPMSQIVNQILKFDLGIGSYEFNKLFTLGRENNNEYKLTKIVSYLMNAAVDAAKDNYIIEGNFNSYTANGAMLMVRLGVDPVNVFKVLLNEDVMKLSKLKQLQTQKITKINTDQYDQQVLNDYSKELVNHLQTNKLNFNDFINKNENFDSKLVLGFWNIIQVAGKELNNDILTAKSDSNGAGKNLSEHSVLFNRIARAAKDSVGSNVNNNFLRGMKLFKSGLDVNKLKFTTDLENSDYTFLGAMMNNSLLLTNHITKNMFLENTDNYRHIVNRISNQFGEDLPVNSDNVKLISNYIYPYIISKSGHGLYNIDEDQVEYLQKEFFKEVLTKKSLNPDNIFLQQLYIDPSTNLVSFPNYKYFSTNDKLLLKDAVEELYNQRDLKNNLTGPLFIHKLVQYAFLTTGFKPTYFNMNEYLPKSYFLNTGHGYYINKLMERMNGISEFIEDEHISKMMTFMAINNDNNYKIASNLYKSDGLYSGKELQNKGTMMKTMVKGTNNFYPFVKDLPGNRLMMLTDIITKKTKEGVEYRVPIYNSINSNSEEVKTEENKNVKRKTKVKLFDLNNIDPENLFRGPHVANELYLQPEVSYRSELAEIYQGHNSTTETDSLDIQTINNLEENNKNETNPDELPGCIS